MIANKEGTIIGILQKSSGGPGIRRMLLGRNFQRTWRRIDAGWCVLVGSWRGCRGLRTSKCIDPWDCEVTSERMRRKRTSSRRCSGGHRSKTNSRSISYCFGQEARVGTSKLHSTPFPQACATRGVLTYVDTANVDSGIVQFHTRTAKYALPQHNLIPDQVQPPLDPFVRQHPWRIWIFKDPDHPTTRWT